jgi:hypothetical protein|eukprot:CAMPEP_0174290888 /NCGR_PEP_ID=MMETSP0809-20121228/30439_1 /TAXON_ID=73025 ORGANISM="Eutreptiella gymnastica-like, Strain CCMP1594" /NCGR_SAMPLE_ID=MMETSP0809 /ASSEMBLY_ACC=CAM_ASM_000658 /LENGTH=53 /DNA_ID=CAMNT_0015389885 /DNA_START=151 /DNA_END=312 /DNA_ORIENTATION=+
MTGGPEAHIPPTKKMPAHEMNVVAKRQTVHKDGDTKSTIGVLGYAAGQYRASP